MNDASIVSNPVLNSHGSIADFWPDLNTVSQKYSPDDAGIFAISLI
jgi:hypothetical protein